MAKGTSFTFEQLECALESAIGFENDERSPPKDAVNSRVHRSPRNHVNGHHCNAHHHHYHHHNQHHNHHHHNRRENYHNNQSDNMNGEEHYTLDQIEFETIWRELETDKDRYNFLRSLYHAASPSGNLTFSEISFGSLGDIAAALSEFDDTVEDFCFVIYILNALSRAKRFSLSLQFLTCDERTECKKLFNKLWKSMSDKQQDLAENEITELTINELIKTYEVD